ncbi:MAG TPA: hypothetical protein VHR65_04595 [Solirubrobacterales bacterium]|jgi:hypothetical protein|nr:hypothetical protein [Solirubrobacterales bacterium]
MLDLGRYLLGAFEVALLVGFSVLGAKFVRARLVPELSGLPASLATSVLAVAILIWAAETLGTFGLFKALPYLALLVVVGATLALTRGWRRGGAISPDPEAAEGEVPSLHALQPRRPEQRVGPPKAPHPDARTSGRGVSFATLIALAISAAAVAHFAAGVKLRLSTGMTGFDSTWYHGPFAAGFFQSGDTWGLHFIAPQFLAWFYPANSEVLHAVGMAAFHRDILSPLLNLGWFVGCLVAGWCVGRPYKVGPVSLALTAVAMSLPALSDQAGEARNDIFGIFFLLAAVAVALNAWEARAEGARGLSTGALIVVGLAAGLAAGTKLNFLLPAAMLVAGLAVIAPRGKRWRAFVAAGLAALAGGGYWYLRNLAHAGNPLPWVKHLGPITLPAPEQTLGGREGHSVLGYLADGSIWSDWFLPGLHHGLTILWPLIAALALAGLLLCLGRGSDPMLRVAGLVGLAATFAWLAAPTSASGPNGTPHGFESGLRYLAPALALAFALLPARSRLAAPSLTSPFFVPGTKKGEVSRLLGRRAAFLAGAALPVLAVAVGYPIQRHYLQHRYEDPSFTTPGLNAAFKWSQGITDARIATTSTRQYPLYGKDLSNQVDYIGAEQPHGGFTAPSTCREWRHLLNAGNYDYVIATRDRIEPGKPTYPQTVRWTEAPNTTVVLRKPPTVIYKLKGPLAPSACH